MKREGRQRGMVRTYPTLSSPLNPRPHRKTPNELTSPPTAGIFTKSPTKPTNHSKFTGKCGRPMCRQCHIHPACKSKEKVKGTQKHKTTSYVVSDDRNLTGLKFLGFSATGVLEYMGGDDDEYRDHQSYDLYYNDDQIEGNFEDLDEGKMVNCVVEVDEIGVSDVVDDDGDDGMSFCEVGFVVVDDGDESWCLVDQML